ncbi:type II toxin-antitoxin system RelE/ParE family toxin [Acetobacterium malicum]|uniref:Type II toxin-antitoxin system RelE/ParE family toxin n=1 Tax=Acetobacterium malicum TaxID=52692 RepID=A0ABR6YU04_9FIRM|nr:MULTISPECIES: type II toxin-antitoxin system RelE/ParE family toxin [Acetobacterium]MBC3898663.1 type II toxin-antitoxin system RelE/ParE family toxin [Acetobacterium malicum]
MQYNLIITESAAELLDHIVNYLVNQLKNPQAAGNLLAEIEHVYDNLECNPKMYAYSDDHLMKSRGYRKALVPHYNYIIIFRIEEETHTIYIMGYFHELELYKNKTS